MKFKINSKLLVACLAILTAASCSKSFFTDVNKNPQAPPGVPPNILLPTIEAALGYTQGGDISRYSGLLMQQVFGNASQSQAYYFYQMNPGTFDNLWPDYYTSVLENNDTLMHISDSLRDNVYAGISRLIMAYSLQVGVDLWGSIPYSQALKGNGNLKPSYDTDKGLYDSVISLVNAGIAKLNAASPGPLTPGGDDFIYGGSATKWIKFGHAIKARIYMHQSKGNAAMATQALAEVALSFGSNGDNAQVVFGSTETSANPWYQFNEQRPGDETFTNTPLATSMQASNDPRFNMFFYPPNDGKGKQQPGGTNYGGLGGYYGSINSPVELITYDELLFMSAEATLRSGGTIAAAQVLYQKAITANMTKLGVDDGSIAAYIAVNGILPATTDAAIAKIANQEYIALFLNPETWTLWRRTGSPSLTPIAGNAIPRRLLYPQTELSYNAANVPSGVTLFVPKIFWDN